MTRGKKGVVVGVSEGERGREGEKGEEKQNIFFTMPT